MMLGGVPSARFVLATYPTNCQAAEKGVPETSFEPDEILLQHILREGVRRTRAKGELLCRQGAVADEVHAMTSGTLGFGMRGVGGSGRYHFFLFAPYLVIPPVDVEGRAPCSIECLVPSEVYTISRRSLIRLMEEGEIPKSAIELNLARLLDLANQQLANLLCRTGAARVAHMLGLLAATMRESMTAKGRDPSERVAIELTQVQLASALGMTPVYLNQILASFKRDGVISIDSGKLFINDEKELRARAMRVHES